MLVMADSSEMRLQDSEKRHDTVEIRLIPLITFWGVRLEQFKMCDRMEKRHFFAN